MVDTQATAHAEDTQNQHTRLWVGLRANELKQLQWQDVDLEGATVRLSRVWTKNRKDEQLPLAPQVVEVLRELQRFAVVSKEGVPRPEQPVAAISSRLLHHFDDDLAAARIAKVDPQGRVACLHSFRHTFGTLRNAAGVDPKTMQTVMRHSTPALALRICVHRDKQRERQAVAALPALMQGKADGAEGDGPAREEAARSSSAS
ncbi:MAG: tyrosine-type recombinase/integrase [Planctomycetota bacterium]